MSYKTVLVGLFTDTNDTWQIDWPTEKVLETQDDDGGNVKAFDQDEELVKYLRGFAPAYNYLIQDYEKTLVKKAFDDMRTVDVVHFATKAGLFCAEDFNEAAKKFEEEGAFVIYEPKAEQKAGNMYAEECKTLVKKIVEVEGWDALYKLIEHKDFMTHPTQPVLL